MRASKDLWNLSMKNVEFEALSLQEQLSALHDGQLDAAQAQILVQASLVDDNLMLQWRSMSAISHVLREQQGGLAVRAVNAATAPQSVLPFAASQEAANDGIFRWKMVAGVASMAAVGSLVWGLLGASGDKALLSQGGMMAAKQAVPAVTAFSNGQSMIAVGGQVAGQDIMMIRDPRLDELLAAHKQFGGVSALQQPAGSLRSVSLASQRP